MTEPERSMTDERTSTDDHTMSVDHAGIATTDADSLATLYVELLGCERVHEEEFREMMVIFLDMGNTYFELLEPRGEGAISRYIDQHGSGIHHLALEVRDIEEALAHAVTCGVELVDTAPRPGAWGHEVAFLHPSSTGGILLEFVKH